MITLRSFIEQEFTDIRESLDSPTEINNIETSREYTYFYFNINNKEFRAVIEQIDDESAIIFEQKINKTYTYNGIQNNLSKQESLSLFSTLKTLIKYLKTKKNYIYTDSKKKLNLYKKILLTMKDVKSVNTFEEHIPYIIGFGINVKMSPKSKFKFKIWK